MKKSLYLIGIISIILIALLLPNKVMAADVTLTQADLEEALNSEVETSKGITAVKENNDSTSFKLASGTYTLGEDITVNEQSIVIPAENTVTLNLAGHAINSQTTTSYSNTILCDGNLTLTGNGTVGAGATEYMKLSSVYVNGGTTTIENGTFTSNITIMNMSNYSSSEGSNTTAPELVIKNATVNVTNDSAINVFGGKATIKGGSYKSNTNVINVSMYGSQDSLSITGGTFRSTKPTLLLYNTKINLKLSGGTFISDEGAFSFGASSSEGEAAVDTSAIAEDFNKFLVSGYKYSKDLVFEKKTNTVDYGGYEEVSYTTTEKEIAVVKEDEISNTETNPTTEPTSEPTSEPASEPTNTPTSTPTTTQAESKVSENTSNTLEVKVAPASETAENKSATTEVNKLIQVLTKGSTVKGIDSKLAEQLNNAIKEGKPVNVEVKSQSVEKALVAEDAKKVEEKIKSGTKIASYFDIDILVSAGTVSGNVTELDNEISLEVDIPTNLPKVASGYTRQYSVIRVHDGVAETLNTKVNGNKISFSSKLFSTYALTYTDVKTSENPSTGDNILLYVAVFTIAVIGSVIVVNRLLKSYKTDKTEK